MTQPHEYAIMMCDVPVDDVTSHDYVIDSNRPSQQRYTRDPVASSGRRVDSYLAPVQTHQPHTRESVDSYLAPVQTQRSTDGHEQYEDLQRRESDNKKYTALEQSDEAAENGDVDDYEDRYTDDPAALAKRG